MALNVMEVCMVALRDYFSTFIVNSDLVDCLLCVLVVLLVSVLLKVFAFGLYK